MKRLLTAVFLAALSICGQAHAQGVTRVCVQSIGANGSNNCPDVSGVNPLPVMIAPTGSTSITGVGAGSTGAVVATLAASANRTTFICGFDVSAIGGTAAIGPIVVAGLSGGNSFTYQMSSTAAGTTLSRTFTPCIAGNAINTAITVTTTADGTATAVDVNAWGFQQ
jgi:hypothetical protein